MQKLMAAEHLVSVDVPSVDTDSLFEELKALFDLPWLWLWLWIVLGQCMERNLGLRFALVI